MNKNDILIVGDSFCSDRVLETDWPKVLVKKLTGSNHDARGAGFPGCSWWSTRRELLTQLKVHIPSIVVVIHTEPTRIPSDEDISLNVVTVENKAIHRVGKPDDVMKDEFAQAGFLYYKHLYSDSFHEWACHSWFKELDDIIGSYEKIEKVIHLYAFARSYNNYTFKKGLTVNDALSPHRDPKPYDKSNHMSPEKNVRLAENIFNLIENYPGDGVRFQENIL